MQGEEDSMRNLREEDTVANQHFQTASFTTVSDHR